MTNTAAPFRGLLSRPLRRSGGWHGFTMVEVLVVMVILAILATLTIPRLLATPGRQAEVEARAVKALLSQAAQQDAVSSGALALHLDTEKHELSLQALGELKDGKRDWAPVTMVRPVRFTSVQVADATADGQSQTTETGFHMVFAGARPRPPVSLLIHTAPDLPGQPRAWQVDLLPNQTVATIRPVKVDAPLAPAEGAAVDLDLEGRRDQPW